VCEGVRSLVRILAGPEKRLIWDGAILEGADSGATLRWYSGTEDQLPDALIESYEGVGNVPGHRGTAYLVLEHFPLLKDGNRLPFLTIEVGAATEASIALTNLGLVNIQQVILTADYYIVFYYGSTRGFMLRLLSDKTDLVQHHQYELAEWSGDANWFWDEDRDTLVRWNSNLMTFDTVDPTGGAFVSHAITAHGSAGPDPSTFIKCGLYYQGNYLFVAGGSASKRTTIYLIDPDSFDPVATYTYDMNAQFTGPVFAPVGGGSYVFGCTTTGIRKYPLSASASSSAGPIAPPQTSYLPAVAAQDPVTGYIWSATDGSFVTEQFVQCTDPETAADVYSDTVAIDPPYRFGWGANTGATPFVFYPSGGTRHVSLCGSATLGSSVAGDYAITFNADTPVYLSQGLGTASGGTHLNTVVWNPVTANLVGFRKSGWLSEAAPADNPLTFPLSAASFYLGAPDLSGSSTAIPQTLSSIVTDLSLRAGLTAGQIDVTQLADDMVDGYAIERSTTVREAIGALMPAYFFDAVESGGIAKFVKRGGAIAAVIDDDELGAHESGTEAPDPLESTRRMENELPKTLFVRYLLEATNYSPASRYARRLVGASGDEQTLDLPLVLSDTKAQEISEVNLHGAWVGRITYRFSLPRKYAFLEPSDIIVVQGHTMRLEKVTYKGGRFQCEARHDDSNVYVPNVVVTETPPTGGEVSTTSETILELA
jgi:hypothetical protein